MVCLQSGLEKGLTEHCFDLLAAQFCYLENPTSGLLLLQYQELITTAEIRYLSCAAIPL
jgi:hypothetical protein